MKFTGERFIPGDDVDMQLSYEHRHRYKYISEYVRGKSVLDIASGEGYGSDILSKTASDVIGIDIDIEAVEFASQKYSDIKNLRFQCGSVTDIPLDNASVDVIISFETIEHIAEHEKMISEFKRVLKPNGMVIISTPDKKVYTDDSGEVNEFHVKELYKYEFRELLTKYFKHVEFCGQRFITVSSILPMDNHMGTLTERRIFGEFPEKDSVYIIAICSDNDLTHIDLSGSLYFEPDLDLYARDKATLRWASSVHKELMKTQQDYFRLEAEYLNFKAQVEKNNDSQDDDI